jgi:glutamate-1-semialdehyde aminotransferase
VFLRQPNASTARREIVADVDDALDARFVGALQHIGAVIVEPIVVNMGMCVDQRHQEIVPEA